PSTSTYTPPQPSVFEPSRASPSAYFPKLSKFPRETHPDSHSLSNEKSLHLWTNHTAKSEPGGAIPVSPNLANLSPYHRLALMTLKRLRKLLQVRQWPVHPVLL